mgnify:FL=1
MENSRKDQRINLQQIASNQDAKNSFFEGVASWLSNSRSYNFLLAGTNEQLNAVRSAMHACKKFHQELSNPNANLASINDRLVQKHQAASEFERSVGTSWLL